MDKFPFFLPVKLNSFSFEPSRYDEWQGGKKINSGLTKIKIECTFFEEGNSAVKLVNNDLQSKLSDCSFDMSVTLEDRVLLLSDPSQLTENNYWPTVPFASSLFSQGGRLVKMTFTMSNPDRLIELY